jgi:histidinol-phosphate aminotransferase
LNRPITPAEPTETPVASPDEPTSIANALPAPEAGLALIKPVVRAQTGYSLSSPPATRKLNQNESPYDFPAELKREVFELAARDWQRYPGFVPEDLRVALSEHYGWVPEGILVGNGSNELIQAVLSVTLGADDVVVAPSPTFSLYRLLTGVLGGRYLPVSLGPGFAFDVDGLIARANQEQARVIVLNSPNNPTGSVLPAGAVERILAETSALVLCDEAYQDFGGPTALTMLRRSSRVVVLRTFSKAMGLAGLRFGLALAHPAVIQEIAKGKLPYNVNLITLAAARTALRHRTVLTGRTQEVIATRDNFLERLRPIPGLVVYPSWANFVLIRTEQPSAKELFLQLYEKYGILVRDVSGSAELSNCLRISIGTPEDMDAVAAALEQIMGQTATT